MDEYKGLVRSLLAALYPVEPEVVERDPMGIL
jgi:hypothetical protein